MKLLKKPAVIIDEMQDQRALQLNRNCLLFALGVLLVAMIVQLSLGLGFLAVADCLFMILFTCVYVSVRSYQSGIFRHYLSLKRKKMETLDEMWAYKLLDIEYECGGLFLVVTMILPFVELAIWQNGVLPLDCLGLGLVLAIISIYGGYSTGIWARTFKPTPKYCLFCGLIGVAFCCISALMLYAHGKITPEEFLYKILFESCVVFLVGAVLGAVTLFLYKKRMEKLESEGDEEE